MSLNQPTALNERRASASPDCGDARIRARLMGPGVAVLFGVLRLALDLIAVGGGVVLALVPAGGPFGGSEMVAALAFAVSLVALLDPRRAFRAWGTTGILESGARAAGAAAVASMLGIAAGVLAGSRRPDAHSLRLWIVTTGLLFGLRTATILAERRAHRRGAMTTPTLILGAGAVGSWVARRLAQQPSLGLRPIGFLDADPPAPFEIDLPVLGTPAEVVEVARRTGARQIIVAFSLERDEALADAVKLCHAAGLAVAAVPRLYESMSDRSVLDHVGGLPLMSFEPVHPRGWQFALKHLVDRTLALVACVVLFPLLLAIAVAVRRSSPGPAIYRQRRVGRGGREFNLLKFRSMASDPEGNAFRPSGGVAPGGVEGLDRRTRIGRWLRTTSLDELPQLLNVVRGEMSLVGPRPERPEFAARFADDVPRYAERHRVRPGITGWAQVNGLRGQTSIADRVEWDNHYIDNWSLGLELRTLALTFAAVLLFREDGRPSLASSGGPPPIQLSAVKAARGALAKPAPDPLDAFRQPGLAPVVSLASIRAGLGRVLASVDTSVGDSVASEPQPLTPWSLPASSAAASGTSAAGPPAPDARSPLSVVRVSPRPPLAPVPPAPSPSAPADEVPPAPGAGEPDARPALAAVPGEQLSDGRWFCGHCGAEPAGGTPPPWGRVCAYCSQGVLLETEASGAPNAGDAFLVIDHRLTVQGLSERAEQILGMARDQAASRPVAELLVDAAAEIPDSDSLAAAIAKAAACEGGAWSGFVRPRDDFGIRTRVRVTHCGPPRAALVILEDVATRPPLGFAASQPVAGSARA